MSTAVVAYSGGLDTSCILAWLKEEPYGFDEVVAVLVDVGQEFDLEESIVAREAPPQADDVLLVDRKDAFAEEQCARAIVTNALYEGKLPARLGALAARDRPGSRRDRARARRRGGRPRLHGQGERPAPLRARVQGALPGREGDRAPPRPDLDA